LRFSDSARAIDAAVNFSVLLNAVANHTAMAVWTNRRQRANRTLETVERVMLSLDHDLERFVVFVFTNFAFSHTKLFRARQRRWPCRHFHFRQNQILSLAFEEDFGSLVDLSADPRLN
jgi:hypothetical protein